MNYNCARIYCAGPLFNSQEQAEMLKIASCLESAGFDTFLPQRDGLEMCVLQEDLVRNGISPNIANDILKRAVFSVDVFQLVKVCDGVIVNLNGRVPDEGAISEAAIAWCAGKTVIGYKADNRSVFNGEDNPLVSGLFDFDLYDDIENAVKAFERSIAHRTNKKKNRLTTSIEKSISIGEQIWKTLEKERKAESIASSLFDVFSFSRPVEKSFIQKIAK